MEIEHKSYNNRIHNGRRQNVSPKITGRLNFHDSRYLVINLQEPSNLSLKLHLKLITYLIEIIR